MSKKIKRPTSFIYENFVWKINYIDAEGDNQGETSCDKKVINIYTRGLDEQIVLEVLTHEANHVILENIIPLVLKVTEGADEIEEHIVRLITPRLSMLYSKNKELRDYVFQEAK